MRRVRHARIRDGEINACGVTFSVDGEGFLIPDPATEVAAALERLANYTVVEVEVEAAPAPKPKPKATRKRRTRKSEDS